MTTDPDAIFYYHQRTKHQLNAYAKGPESLDWEDQPKAFRHFIGCQNIKLPKPGTETVCLFGDLDKPEQISSQPLSLTSLGLLLELAFGLSAWKQFGPDRWALRCNPSSGNLHPTEAYLLCTDPALLQPGVYHYVSYDHHLERRSLLNAENAAPSLYLGLSSIHWREAWKYGERAFRYCQHDIGHALAALSYAAACLGWSIELLSETADADLAHYLGLDRSADFIEHEHEAADLLCRLHIHPQDPNLLNSSNLTHSLQSVEWYGKAEPLSQRHFYRWPIIDDISAQTQKPAIAQVRWQPSSLALPAPSHNLNASRLIRQRRSAQQFNGKAEALPYSDFQRIISALLANTKPPFNAWNWPPQVHIVLFIHRVAGLESGLYLLPRTEQALPELQQAFSDDFIWQTCTLPFDLYQLTPGNVKQAAKTLSCHQPIASDSAFSLGMLARFAGNIENEPWRYKQLFWECGMLGQILYLEAEAAGFRGTGIGCFFDDAVHGVLGLKDHEWQSLYHFTLGVPLEDNRLQTLAAYEHLV